MATLLTADWHLSDDPRDAYRLRIIKDVFPKLIKKYKIDVLLNLGDLTEAKGGHSAELVNEVADIFEGLSLLCFVLIAQGNHDWESSPDNPFFRFLEIVRGVDWIQRPTPLVDAFSDGPDPKKLPNAIILPHSADPERDWKDVDFKKYEWALAHQTFANATSDSGFKLSGVPLSIFPKGLKIISGDIHRPQTVGPLTYVGSPYTVDFGDDFEARCLLIKDSGELASVPIEGPQKRLVEASSLGDLEKKLKALNEGDIVKVKLNIRAEDQADWGKFAAEARDLGAHYEVAVHMVQPVITDKGTSMLKKGAQAVQRTDEELLQDYGNARAVDEGTLKVGLKLL